MNREENRSSTKGTEIGRNEATVEIGDLLDNSAYFNRRSGTIFIRKELVLG
jgi:hypothetical protein